MDWMELNARGLIPGPEESETAFLQRVEAAVVNPGMGCDLTGRLFDVRPDWVSLVVSDRGLAPWHGAVTVIDGGKAALQMRKRLPRWHDRDEIIAHELAHAGRVAFNEPKFEEFFAYRTSKSRMRRWLGPVIERSWEVWLLLVVLLAGGWFPLAPLAVIFIGFTRLGRRHRRLYSCVRNLSRVYGKEKAWAVAYRLTDREITAAATGKLRSDNSLRWRMISAVYGPLS